MEGVIVKSGRLAKRRNQGTAYHRLATSCDNSDECRFDATRERQGVCDPAQGFHLAIIDDEVVRRDLLIPGVAASLPVAQDPALAEGERVRDTGALVSLHRFLPLIPCMGN